MKITYHGIKFPLRGFPSYPSNGLMPTKHIVVLNDDKVRRRVYDRWENGRLHALVKINGEPMDLTPAQIKQIGYSPKTARTRSH